MLHALQLQPFFNERLEEKKERNKDKQISSGKGPTVTLKMLDEKLKQFLELIKVTGLDQGDGP